MQQRVRRGRATGFQTCLALGQLIQVSHKSGAIDVIRNAALGSKGTLSYSQQPTKSSSLADASPHDSMQIVTEQLSQQYTPSEMPMQRNHEAAAPRQARGNCVMARNASQYASSRPHKKRCTHAEMKAAEVCA